jgi:hypothetical protein
VGTGAAYWHTLAAGLHLTATAPAQRLRHAQ